MAKAFQRLLERLGSSDPDILDFLNGDGMGQLQSINQEVIRLS
jgi:hypothetical protein